MSAKFVLKPQEWSLTSLLIQSGASQLNATARVTDPASLAVDAQYELVLDMKDAAAITRTPQLRSGKLTAKGLGAFSPHSVSANGEASLADLGWQDSSVRLERINAKTPFSMRNDELMLPHI